jgi:hypothetical protein
MYSLSKVFHAYVPIYLRHGNNSISLNLFYNRLKITLET